VIGMGLLTASADFNGYCRKRELGWGEEGSETSEKDLRSKTPSRRLPGGVERTWEKRAD